MAGAAYVFTDFDDESRNKVVLAVSRHAANRGAALQAAREWERMGDGYREELGILRRRIDERDWQGAVEFFNREMGAVAHLMITENVRRLKAEPIKTKEVR